MKKQKSEHALAIIKAGISAVPVVGGPIASLIGDYVPTATQQSIEGMIAYLVEYLERLRDRIDTVVISKDEFTDHFKSAYLCVVRTTRGEKIRAASAVIANALLKPGDPDKFSYSELDHLARAVDELSVGVIHVLGVVYDRALPAADQRQPEKSYRIDFHQIRVDLSYEPSLLLGLLEELRAKNLVHQWALPSVREPEYGNYPFELTPLGVRFVERLLRW
ncbi:MAG: hypothetical protein KAU06_00985 [Candidatus Marinimicrobia bacterium]|nr:hypothetical protein [Candidatus Neomarinimicrobiota bacterium]